MTCPTPATDDQLAAAIERGLATGTLVAVDDALLARLAADRPMDGYLARYGSTATAPTARNATRRRR